MVGIKCGGIMKDNVSGWIIGFCLFIIYICCLR